MCQLSIGSTCLLDISFELYVLELFIRASVGVDILLSLSWHFLDLMPHTSVALYCFDASDGCLKMHGSCRWAQHSVPSLPLNDSLAMLCFVI